MSKKRESNAIANILGGHGVPAAAAPAALQRAGLPLENWCALSCKLNSRGRRASERTGDEEGGGPARCPQTALTSISL